MALDLPHHVRGRVARERDLAGDLEPVDRLDQADRADLFEILERLAPAGEAPCQ
jgi:hypothetical protein